jgi:LemA protein
MTTDAVAIAVVAILLIPGGWWVSHTRLVAARNDVAGSWADVDAELQRRHDLVPQLVSAVQAAATHERELLVELARRQDVAAAAPHTPLTASALEPPLAEAVAQVLALRERYPQLNSQSNFLDLQRQLSLTEDRIAAERRYYNTRVEQLNRRIDAFPSGIVARHHGFTKADFFDM